MKRIRGGAERKSQKGTNMTRVCGIDFGLVVFAAVSDGKIVKIEGTRNLTNTAQAILELVAYVGEKYDVIVVEGLKGTGSIAHAIRWFKKSMKRQYPGKRVISADNNYPSTKLCNACGRFNNLGSSRMYICIGCGAEEDRDLNAAKNLKDWHTRGQYWKDDSWWTDD